jgi:hypothetical protein
VFTDLDNAFTGPGSAPAEQAFGIAIVNPNAVTADVEITGIDSGAPARLASLRVAPRSAELVTLPARTVDGSSRPDAHDGSHTALTPGGYRLDASLPISVTMFNPIVPSASSDAALVLPVTALGASYVVGGFEQTIADDESFERDFDPNSENEDLRAFLAIVAVEPETAVEVEIGPGVRLAADGVIVPGDAAIETLQVELGAFDVLNLESDGYGSGFGGTRVRASRAVAVFTGAEAVDIPLAGMLSTRQCCADHLESQLVADPWLGRRYVIAHSPNRAAAINGALVEGYPALPETEEVDFIRIVAPEAAVVQTTLDPPFDRLELAAGEQRSLSVARDFVLEASSPVAVLQAVGGQSTTFIQRGLPGGDPALISPAAVEQHVAEYVFATPDGFPFVFVMASAPAHADLVLDGVDASALCATDAIEGDGDWIAYRCPLAHPRVDPDRAQVTLDPDGSVVHVLSASEPIGAWVYAFGAFSSYAYVAGKQLGGD